ncbi:flagellar biosynthetic protein FliP [Denitrovibrio acetiphilus DSM 12809]|uniref:Flagellar biosynthetic protein FliP n=1 Tax=Denitrovibrio acetiphilus (strain DSM 12809 / NBRC 114555 / N2460) TaxID=522772 RepID=D4H2N4_DENA2|nr:flagellar type III secretion system pore protein FliP [Denitrovibrio acetiphilus]ADD67095.1 flagellar biosynthetic protein FliP [Denitrovibrio acetiphilus DSM 12809]
MVLFLLAIPFTAVLAADPIPFPAFRFGMEQANSPQDVAVTIQIMLLMTFISIAPGFLVLMTSFTRIVIVFSLLRTAMGTSQMPPNQVLLSLALILTFYIMNPVFTEMYNKGLGPYFEETITFQEMVSEVKKPLRKFMLYNTRKQDVRTFLSISGEARPKTADDIPDLVLLSSFVVSELTTAFQMGFLLFLPFLIIDFVVASVLLSMGMMMLPPVMISVPFKIMLFVLVDGWGLIVTSIVKSFG